MYTFKTSGVCAKEIHFKIEGDTIVEVDFFNGCAGNLIGIKHLVQGQRVDAVIEKLKGIPCGGKDTSCPDQLAIALQTYLNQAR